MNRIKSFFKWFTRRHQGKVNLGRCMLYLNYSPRTYRLLFNLEGGRDWTVIELGLGPFYFDLNAVWRKDEEDVK